MRKSNFLIICLLMTVLLLVPAGCSEPPQPADETPALETTPVQTKYSSSISGHVYDAATNEPLGNVVVQVYGTHGSTGPITGVTAADGSYTVTRLNAGESTLAIDAIRSGGYITQFYKGKVTTYPGQDTPGIDFYLVKGGSISGTIYKPDGVTPAGNATVFFVQLSGARTPPQKLYGCEPQPEMITFPSYNNGRYKITGLNTGDYNLLVTWKSGDEKYVSGNTTIARCQAGQETNNIDFVLGEGGSISGNVYQYNSRTPVTGGELRARLYAIRERTTINKDGTYLLENIIPGDWRIEYSRYPLEEIRVASGETTVKDVERH